MRQFYLVIAAAVALISALTFAPPRADAAAAMPVPSGMQTAIQESSLLEDIAYVCRRVWRCGPYGCGWRRVCNYTAPRYYRPYYAPAPYYYAPRPYYRPYGPHFYYRW